MENNNQFDDLLTSYLANELNEEDRKTAENWIDASGENLRYFESLKKAWQLAEAGKVLDYVLTDMNVDEKWLHFRQNLALEETKIIPLDQGETAEYDPTAKPAPRSILKKYIIRFGIAASVLLIIGLGWNSFFPKTEQPVAVRNDKPGAPKFVERHITNITGHDKIVLLPDSSSIVLSNEAELMYKEPFVNSRDITLIGKAYFKVAKDKTKPFTVVSGAITTTALGTAFSVTALKNANTITVRLYEGRVVLKALDKSNLRMQKDVYLSPGQEYIYSDDKAGILRSFASREKKAGEPILNEGSTNDNPFIQDDKGSWYMFNNQSLAQVLDQLAVLYNVRIVYDKKDVKHIYFTGRYNKTDSLETILARIGKLNELTIVKKDTVFTISK